jgi:hypothetical protein
VATVHVTSATSPTVLGIRAKEANTDLLKLAKSGTKVRASVDKRSWMIRISSELPISSTGKKIRRSEKLKLVAEGTENERRRESARRRESVRRRERVKRRESARGREIGKFGESKRKRNRSLTLRTKGEKLWLV